MIVYYFKLAIRNLLRYKSQSIISILGLTIGFIAFILGLCWYHWEHSFDTFHPDWKNIYTVTTSGMFKAADGSDMERNDFLHNKAKDYVVSLPEIEEACSIGLVKYNSEGTGKMWLGLVADTTFFSMFQNIFIEGGLAGNPYDGKSVVLTQTLAQQLYGDSLCTGKEFNVNEKISFNIAGVMKDYPGNSGFNFDYILLSTQINSRSLYVKVNTNSDIQALKSKVEAFKLDDRADMNSYRPQLSFKLRSLPEIHLNCFPELKSRIRNINILACAGILAFLSALMNLLVLFLGQQQQKIRNNFTFQILGASFRGVLGKNLIQLLLPLFISLLLVLAAIEIILPYYQQYTQLENYGFYEGVVKLQSKDGVIRASLFIYIASSVIFLFLSVPPIISLLKRRGHTVSRALKNSLIIGQIFIGSLFFIASIGFYAQFRFTANADKGIVLDNIWQIDLGFNAIYEKDCRPFGDLLRNNPLIEDVTAMPMPVIIPRGEFYCSHIVELPIEGYDMDTRSMDNCMAVQPNFLSFFGLKMKEGEWLTVNQDEHNYVVNETGAQKLGIEQLVGRYIKSDGGDGEQPTSKITGIVADYYYCPMQYAIDKTFFSILKEDEMTRRHMSAQYYYIKVKPENTEKALEYARTLYKDFSKEEVDPANQFIYLPALMDDFNQSEKAMFSIFSLLALICILISSFGIYSLVAISTEQRKKEIAIRKINGAMFADILKLFLKEYFVLVVLANVIAIPLGYLFLSRWLETYAYHTQLHIGLFISVFLITCLIVIFTVSKQVISAMRVNPADIIKTE